MNRQIVSKLFRNYSSALLIAIGAVVSASCVGAFMLDAGGARGGSSRFPYLRWAELTDSERTQHCFFTRWGSTDAPDLWVVLDPDGKPTGVNAGGLIEVRCPAPFSPLGVSVYRACVYGTPPAPVSNPVKSGVYDKDGLLVGCKR